MTDPISRLLAAPPALPVAAGLDRLRSLLAASTSAVVTAPPGTGKTTLVPPLVADVVGPAGGRVVVTQPRRVATRAAARRLAGLLGEDVGATVGYAVRGEHRSGPLTRVEVVTAGLLLRRLQADPDLPGVAAVVLDEVHERSLDSDLLLALLLDSRALRDDLVVVAMSATLDLERLPALLGTDGEAPVLDIPSALHPVEERWAPPPSGVARLAPGGVPREMLAHVAATALDTLDRESGDLLVFLPGAREVDDVVARLRASVPDGVDVLALHGRLGAAAQDAALVPSPAGRRRVVVATNVAESSLTVPGVRLVVDALLTREPRLDVSTGMSGLVTVGAARASGVQRAGRAGREGPGVVVRCCSPVDWARAPQVPTPEILSADLTGTALELAAWGAPGGGGLAWIDPPPGPTLTVATATLELLGLTEPGGGITALGRAVACLPAPVRQARALLAAGGRTGLRPAAEATALLTADLRAPGGDLAALARQVRGGVPAWRTEARRLEQAGERALRRLPTGALGAYPGTGAGRAAAARAASKVVGLAEAAGLVAALARPEWVARRRGEAPSPGQEASYVTVGGTGLRVAAGSVLASAEWIAVADVDRSPGRAEALVRAGAAIDEELALEVAGAWLTESETMSWQGSRLRVQRRRSLGAITLSTTPAAASPQAVAQAVVERCRQEGLEVLPWGEGARLRARMRLLHETLGEPWPAVDDAHLLERAEEWLAPAAQALAGGRRLDLERLDVEAALRALLPWPEAARLDELAPEYLQVPSGSRVRVDYDGERPVLAVRVQECFGWDRTPVVAGVPVLLHLLSPARRPVAVTDDLRSFWQGPYQQVRRELRGRYPKHAWPEDPWTAPALRGTKKRG